MTDVDSAALEVVDAIFSDIRGRAVIKWLFDTHGTEHFIAKFDDGEELRGIDLEVQGQIKASWQKIVAEGLSKFSRPVGWRCFHCDEVFFTANDARLHFGMDQCSDPACKIKMGAEKSLLVALRRAETELQDAWAAIHNENTEAAKAYYAQQSRHGEQLRAAEELGFERGIKDSTAHVAALEEQALRDRKLRDEAQHDALLWQYNIATGDHPTLLVTVWNQRKEAIARATAAERELAEHKSAYTLAHGIFWTETKRLTNALTDLCDAYAACNSEDHAAHRMARAVLSRNSPDPTHRHLKTGGLYAVLCEGKMQAADWYVLRPDGNDVSIDMSEVVIYRSLGDGSAWVRPKNEFYDGRFEAVGQALASTGGEHHAE